MNKHCFPKMKTVKDIQFEIFVYIFHDMLRLKKNEHKDNSQIMNFLNQISNLSETLSPKHYFNFEKRFLQ